MIKNEAQSTHVFQEYSRINISDTFPTHFRHISDTFPTHLRHIFFLSMILFLTSILTFPDILCPYPFLTCHHIWDVNHRKKRKTRHNRHAFFKNIQELTFPTYLRHIYDTFPAHAHTHTHFRHISDTFPTHFQHISDTFPTHFQHISDTFPKHFRHISDTSPTHLLHISNTFPTHFQHVSDTFQVTFSLQIIKSTRIFQEYARVARIFQKVSKWTGNVFLTNDQKLDTVDMFSPKMSRMFKERRSERVTFCLQMIKNDTRSTCFFSKLIKKFHTVGSPLGEWCQDWLQPWPQFVAGSSPLRTVSQCKRNKNVKVDQNYPQKNDRQMMIYKKKQCKTIEEFIHFGMQARRRRFFGVFRCNVINL